MSARHTIVSVALIAGTSAWAAPEFRSIEDCVSQTDNNKRLTCYDQMHGVKPTPVVAEVPAGTADATQAGTTERKAPAKPRFKVSLRASSDVSMAGDMEVGSKPASVQLSRSDGKSTNAVDAALLIVARHGLNNAGAFDGWQPFAGLNWNRSSGVKIPFDDRGMLLGITGITSDPGPDGSTLQGTLRLGRQWDILGHARANQFSANFDWLNMPWLRTFILVPQFGLLTSASSGPASEGPFGRRTGLYLGARYELPLAELVPRLGVEAEASAYRDLSASNGLERLNTHHARVAITFDLAQVKARTGWRPKLSLSRETGSDPVTQLGPMHETKLTLGVLYDL